MRQQEIDNSTEKEVKDDLEEEGNRENNNNLNLSSNETIESGLKRKSMMILW